MDDIPLALNDFQGRLIVGAGSVIRLFEMGKKRLLKKCENKQVDTRISKIDVNGQRIYVNTVSRSIFGLRYKPNENLFYLVVDDPVPRFMVSSTLLDYDTIAGSDKFENFFVLRLPANCDEENDEDPIGTKTKWKQGYLNGSAFKLDNLANFFKGQLITKMQKVRLSADATEVILFATSLGGIGAFVPFKSREEVDFFTHLEMYVRLENPPLSGRDHQAYRSSYAPVKCVIDGDLIEEFGKLPLDRQKMVAGEMNMLHFEVVKKIEEIRESIF